MIGMVAARAPAGKQHLRTDKRPIHRGNSVPTRLNLTLHLQGKPLGLNARFQK
jgi:hypothetical protein